MSDTALSSGRDLHQHTTTTVSLVHVHLMNVVSLSSLDMVMRHTQWVMVIVSMGYWVMVHGSCTMGHGSLFQWVTGSWVKHDGSLVHGSCTMGHGSLFQWVTGSWIKHDGSLGHRSLPMTHFLLCATHNTTNNTS